MRHQGKRLSLLTLPEARLFYSVPKFNADEREYFFTFSDEILELAKRFNKVFYIWIIFEVRKRKFPTPSN